MPVRKIITIDEDKCDGCGLCIDACHEGAIKLVDEKAKLVSDIYCDGLGDCLGECPQDAITIVERDADDFNEKAVADHLATLREQKRPGGAAAGEAAVAAPMGGCPGAAMRELKPLGQQAAAPAAEGAQPSTLANWPLQLHLVPAQAPWLKGAKLLIAADCVPFAYADFHRGMLAGKSLIIGCPKLDDTVAYVDKLTAIFESNALQSVEVAIMEVPCCRGLVHLVQQAAEASGTGLKPELSVIGIRGERMGS